MKAIIACVLVTCAGFASAASVEPADPVETRQVRMQDARDASAELRALLEQDNPDITRVRDEIARIKQLSVNTYFLFPQGTWGAPDGESAARPEIWTDADGFRQAQDRLALAAELLVLRGEANDIQGARQAFASVRESCQSCHRTYRYRNPE